MRSAFPTVTIFSATDRSVVRPEHSHWAIEPDGPHQVIEDREGDGLTIEISVPYQYTCEDPSCFGTFNVVDYEILED